jgi:uncharacterized protein GlcG (DUF336 family)
MLTLDQAQKIVAAALSAAREQKLKPMGIVVLDERGAIRAAATEDGSALARWKVAHAKAHGAISLGVSSRALGVMAVERPHFIAAIASSVVEGGLVPVAGGVLIRDAAGAVIGAAGASGDTSDNDEALLIAAINSVGLGV